MFNKDSSKPQHLLASGEHPLSKQRTFDRAHAKTSNKFDICSYYIFFCFSDIHFVESFTVLRFKVL